MSRTLRTDLLAAATAFCDAFAAGSPLDTIIAFFSTSTAPVAIEHGLPQLAPFLGRTFEGLPGVVQYFVTVGNSATYTDMRFQDWIVDTQERKVSVRGRGIFTWKSTGQKWDETFTYTLDFDEELKVKRYQVWADSGAAYLARTGKLDELMKSASDRET
ncbi:hypothetical protein BV25DRAFT_1913569 [Artomyces pyxidatus]|uniref:Uncharacterized protein n=1 Tax=Artomyces pyxidatus TaxID=48021 RepID=A0ACB8T9P7_9AGAM|nr:hypothetical protein BV25DRAFT_1913569 [Artomyces pyxidatus]